MSRLAGLLASMRLALAALLFWVLGPVPAAAQQSTVSWRDWSFSTEVNGNYEGLVLRDVSFNRRQLLRKISMPTIRVFYDNNACGPFSDRLGGTLSPIPWADNAKLVQRSFTINGVDWYEVGIRDRIGNYDLYQAYYLSAYGVLEAHIYGKGLQCVVNHVHYPNWRMDFQLDGAASNLIERNAGDGFVALVTEFNAAATSAVNHAWRVRNVATGLTVDLQPGFADFRIPDGSTQVPVTAYDRNTVFGRQYRASEDVGWKVGPNVQVPYGNDESLADEVLWYEAYLPHLASEGQALWHSTGVRLVSSITGVPPSPGTASLVVRARADVAAGAGAAMEVRVNGSRIATTEVNAVNYQDYSFNVPAIAPGGRIDVTFTNDYYLEGSADRNLYIDRIVVNGGTTILATDSVVVVDQGSGAAAFDGLDTAPGRAELWSNGSLRFVTPRGVTPPSPPTMIAEIEPNDSRNAAQWIGLLSTVSATMPTNNDDWFAIPVNVGQTVNARMTPPANGDYDVRLTDDSGRQIASSRNGVGVADVVTWTNRGSAPVTVFARVFYYLGAYAPYRLEVY